MWVSEEATSRTGHLAKTSKKEGALWGLPGMERVSTKAGGEKPVRGQSSRCKGARRGLGCE